MKLLLVGYGRMGKAVEQQAMSRNHEIVHVLQDAEDAAWDNLPHLKADVAIEFTHPESACNNLIKLMEAGIPVVTGTTGWYNRLEEMRIQTQMKKGCLVYGSNFSPGVLLLNKAVEAISKHAATFGYDYFIEERHHIHKLDAPSGTALTLLSLITPHFPDTNPDVERISSIRSGEIIGEHTVGFTSTNDQIELYHQAFNRNGFALGALIAAEWAITQKGFYEFKDIL